MPFDSSAILFDEAGKLGLRFVLLRGGATQTRQLEAELPTALRPETLDACIADIERLARISRTFYGGQADRHGRCNRRDRSERAGS